MKQLNDDIYRYVDDILKPEDIHESRVVSNASASNGVFVVLALILSVVHGFNLYLFLNENIYSAIPVLIHLVVVGITAAITYAQYKAGGDVHHLAGLAIVSATTGVFGTIGALFGFLAMIVFRQKNIAFKDWYESIFPTDTPLDSEILYDDIVEGQDENPRPYGVMPFTDVMRVGSEEQKRRALSSMTMQFNPKLAPAFKIALHDSSNTIRVQAATAIAKIERKFMNMREKIEAARAKEPKNPQILFALARFYDDYAFTGILDPELEKANRERAISTYKTFLQQDPNNAEAWVSIGRLLFRNEQWEDAAEWFKHAMERGWKVKNMILWYFEALYRQGDFRGLRRAVAEHGRGIVNQEELPQQIRDAVALWQQAA